MLVKNVFWSLGGQAIQMSISFITNMLLSRMLTSYEFGQLGIIMFFLSIANVFIDGGLGGALVRKQNSTKVDYSTVFVLNLAISVLLYFIVYLSSGTVSDFYSDNNLSILLKASFVVILFNAFTLTQTARLASEMNFKFISLSKITATLVSCAAAFFLAYFGYGIWALVFMQIIYSFVNSLIINIGSGFYFGLGFSIVSAKELYGFGLGLSLSSLLTTAFDNIYQMVIGKYFSIGLSGFYYQGKKLQEVPVTVINIALQGPVYSYLSKKQDDLKEFLSQYYKISKIVMMCSGLITLLIYIYADIIIRLIYGFKWMESAHFMKLLSLASFFYLLEMSNRVVFKVFARTKAVLILEIFKKSLQSIGLAIGIYLKSIEVLLISFIVSSAIGYIVNLFVTKNVLKIKDFEDFVILIKVVIAIALSAVVSFYFLKLVETNSFLDIIYIIPTTIFYILICFYFRFFDNLKIQK